jgi:hypothetical protein
MFEMLEFEFRPRPPRLAPPRPRGRARPVSWRGPQGGWWPDPYDRPYSLTVNFSEPDEAPVLDETPPMLGATLARMQADMRPEYVRIGTLPQALADRRATGPGLYFLELPPKEGKPWGYSGMSMDLHARLLKHRLCARMMQVEPARITVYVATGLHKGQYRSGEALRRHLLAVERSVYDLMKRHYDGRLANQKRELELELFGEEVLHHGRCACGRCRSWRGQFELIGPGAPP